MRQVDQGNPSRHDVRMSKQRSALNIDEPARKHEARIERPHLAQEYKERGALDDLESLCKGLMPHAAMCARGEVSAEFVARRYRGATPE